MTCKTGTQSATSAIPANFLLRAAFIPPCIAAASGPLANTQDSAALSNQTNAIATCSTQGVKGLSVAFDLPTQIGMDSDHPLAHGEVGKVGVAIDSLEDMQTLFDGIPLENVSTSMTINSTAAILLALYVAVAKQQGANLKRLAGTVQNDILKEYIARGTYIYPLRPAMRIVTDIFAWCRHEISQLERHFDFRLSHPRSRLDRSARSRLHSRKRNRLRGSRSGCGPRRGRIRAATVILLQLPQRATDANRKIPRRPASMGPHHARPFRARAISVR